MRRLTIALGLVMLCVTAFAWADVTGKWEATATGENCPPDKAIIDMKQTGADVTATFDGGGPALKGRVTGDDVTFESAASPDAPDMPPMKMVLKLVDGHLKGEMSLGTMFKCAVDMVKK
jgi:hypothetical protein